MLGWIPSAISDTGRIGYLEAGLVGRPVDDRGLEVGPVQWTAEVVYLSATSERVRDRPEIAELAAIDLVLFDAGRSRSEGEPVQTVRSRGMASYHLARPGPPVVRTTPWVGTC